MNKRIFLSGLLFFFFSCLIWTQVPRKFLYQAVLRDDGGRIMANTSLEVRLSILQGSSSGEAVWSETAEVTTNAQGLFSLTAGNEIPLEVDWSRDNLFLQVEIDLHDGQGYRVMGTTGMVSVPYALYAADVGDKDDADADPLNEIQDLHLSNNILTITGNTSPTRVDLTPYLDNPGWVTVGEDTLAYAGSVTVGTDNASGSKLAVQGDDVSSEDPLFEVKRKDGQTVFAVYNSGVRVFVDAGENKGPRGGFAIGGFDYDKGAVQDYLVVTPDSVRIYIDPTDNKGPRGGFAIGGYDYGKGYGHEYLRVTDDSTRVYVRNSEKGPRGGFAIGGYDYNKADGVTNFLDLTPENYLIGHESGKNLTSGYYNSFIGYQAGMNTTIGRSNLFLGYQAGIKNESGSRNIFLGEYAGSGNVDQNDNIAIGYYAGWKSNAEDNVFIGSSAGSNHLEGGLNIFIGNDAGNYLDHGTQNIFMGYRSGYASAGAESNASQNVLIGDYTAFWLTTGSQNTLLGGYSGSYMEAGSYNVMTGYQSGYQMRSGNENVFLGSGSGYQNQRGSRNVFLGSHSGYNEQGSDKLYIENSDADSSSALIWGDFARDLLVLNARVGVGTTETAERLTVNGNLALTPGDNRYVGMADGTHTLVLGPSSSTSVYPWAALLTAHGTVRIRIDDDPAKGMNMDSKGFVGFGIQTPSYRIELPNTADAGGQARANAWLTNSDGRIKKKRHPLDYGLAQVMELTPVRYEQHASVFRGGRLELEKQSRETIGLVAQDVYRVVPEAVERPADENASLWCMDYQKLIPVMIKGMQEQQQLIKEMQEKIERLEKELKKLKKRR